MTLTQVWGSLLIFILCPLLGGLPLISWLTFALTAKRLRKLGTGNVSVSAAFYHGGRVAGILAVLSEALKGVLAVLLARAFFPAHPEWEIIALIALVFGRYTIAKGAGTTNVVWGYVVHDAIAALLVFIVGGIGFTILREKRQARIAILILFPLMTALLHPQASALIVTTIALGCLLGWIYQQIPDDLNLKSEAAQQESQSMFKFFRGDRAFVSLDQSLQAHKAGAKAATLAHLKQLGYPVPEGWVLFPGDDPQPLIERLHPSSQEPWVVRSSAIGEDSESASAAGQYTTILNVTRSQDLLPAIVQCLASYDQPSAVQYRRDRHLPDAAMVVLIQKQIRGVFSGVAFSRDPILRQGEMVAIEALPGDAAQVVSGQVTPESYRVRVPISSAESWNLPDDVTLEIEGTGATPPRLIQQVAFLARHLETQFHGLPQDIEWTFDGQHLWLLQARPITTLLPIWTRKIAAEVIPGAIRPLTWSINRPLTCGVWGDLFTIVLGDRTQGLDFTETATLHYSHAYFNASLLGNLFRRMGLPAESLEFLTRGAKFSKPPLQSTLQNLPGLLKLLGRELRLEQDFRRDDRHKFTPFLAQAATHSPVDRSATDLLSRIDLILDLLTIATYYSILAPLSAALRKAILRVPDERIDQGDTPEVAALRELQALATEVEVRSENIFEQLAEDADGQRILQRFDQILQRYGYLSEVGTDIAVATWRENPQPVRELFAQFCLHPPRAIVPSRQDSAVQSRFRLKGRVTEVYSRLLAELRGCFVALEIMGSQQGFWETGDIFFLQWAEVRQAFVGSASHDRLREIVAQRRSQFLQDCQLASVPAIVYGDDPPLPELQNWPSSQQVQGIGASPGQVEGRIKVMRSLSIAAEIDRHTILVVPYTDSGWAPLLARAGGLISEVGGRLSHGAIVAREYRIPAVMDVPNATNLFHDGQTVRLNGQQGTVEIL
ncbi:MAG: pyruvate phosphate dikinase PEP/pyruvate-binding protein [Leptolyngbyaceae cyanobacterium CSU_1_3]|nr:pyruvate phosphate dikinase PEP/pyruvate-binding protein [Leptolyngbyaceae cyanobacterium CSU_1_3]